MKVPRPDLRSLRASIDAGAVEEFCRLHKTSDRVAAAILPIVRVLIRREVARLRLSTTYVDDLVQDVQLYVCRHEDSLRSASVGRFITWMWRVAQHVVVDFHRHHEQIRKTEASWPGTYRVSSGRCSQTTIPGDGEDGVAVLEDPMEIAVAKERSDSVAHAISQLTQRQRDALMAWLLRGETLAAIARRHDISRFSVSRDVKEALVLLESLLRRFDR